MNSGFRSRCVPNYRILKEEQINEIHAASLEVLETVGVRIDAPEGVQLLHDEGCRVKDGNVVQITSEIVERCIRSAPSQITIFDRMGSEAMQLEGNNIHFGLGTDLIKTIDLRTGELRPSCLQDVADAARTADKLEEIDFIASFALPDDVPTNMMYIESFRATTTNSPKPIFFTAAGQEDLSVILDMAAVIAGGKAQLREKPFLIHYSQPTSPLTHSQGAVKKLFLCADNGIPITYTPGMIPGASGPVTMAGAITVANAEALSGIVLHQLRAEGAPIISGFGIQPMDMKTSVAPYASPEKRLTKSACADLYHYYGIPMWGTAGCSDAHSLDQQAGMEASMSILMSALNGANLIHDVGYLGQGLIGSPASIIMGSELISYAKRIMRGFDISRERIGMDVIKKVGPGGHYLTEEQTLKLHQEEIWRPKFLNRETLETWSSEGARDYGKIVTQKAIDILETHKPEPLPQDICLAIDQIVKDSEKILSDLYFEA
jgi:trimethylamine--corrinoid protein Co-methyltransferase